MDKVVYRARPGADYRDTMKLLTRHGIEAFPLDAPNPDPTMEYASKGTAAIRIAVADDQAEAAHILLAERENKRAPRTAALAHSLRWQMMGGGVIALAVFGVCYLWTGELADAISSGGLAWLAGFVLIAQLSARLAKRN